MVIAIDGPAGSGKTTTAKKTAEKLGFIHINTGAMYRGIALKCIQRKINPADLSAIDNILSQTEFKLGGEDGSAMFMDGVDISAEITTTKVTELVSRVSAIFQVREKLVQYQQKMAKGLDVVLEGRDIGTVVFPNADVKIYLIADIRERAKRRLNELKTKGETVTIEAVIKILKERDRKDSTREHSPLKKAQDAIEINTTELTIAEQVDCIMEIINNKTK